jgi:tetratricopeptide (TPR) repeat protein
MFHPTPADPWAGTECWLHQIDALVRLEAGIKKLQESKNGGFENKELLKASSNDFIAAATLHHPKGYSYMGYLFLILSMPNKAFQYFEQALAIDPFEIDARRLILHLKTQARELEQFKEAKKNDPENENSNVFDKEDPVPAILCVFAVAFHFSSSWAVFPSSK